MSSTPTSTGVHQRVTSRLAAGFVVFLIPTIAQAKSTLEDRIGPLIESHRGKVAVAVEHLETGEAFEHRGDEPMPTASLIKVCVMVEAYRQNEEETIDLNDHVTLNDDDKVPGSGVLTYHFSEGASFSIRDAVQLMIAYSDNTATNLVLDQIGLPSTAETMEALGYPNSKIHSKVFRRETSVFPERSPRFGLGSTTASEMARLFKQLHKKELVSESASEAMREHLLACQDKQTIVRDLPRGTKVAFKTGAVGGIRTSAGIVESPGGPFAICILTEENDDERFDDNNAAQRLMGRIAREAYDHFNQLPEEPSEEEPAVLKLGAEGRRVEALQRRLNARLDPSPSLSVDGVFGPLTESALKTFQKENDLEVTGVADSKTWEALGPSPRSEREVPDPEVVNAEVLEKEPPDDLDGPPFVTSKAWVVVDGSTGETIAGENENESLDMASTTKIMTALVVLRMAESDPDVLDEVLTFSERADNTTGSTSGVRAGERVSVGELLYGLLLPSGNDASVALAEHFGSRLDPPDDDPNEIDPLPRFVAEMNRVADELGLEQTSFRNPHGLTARNHHASARDLARLARIALGNPRFAEYVSTRRRGATLYDLEDRGRNVLWRNTNRLLPIEGYDGVKTGTTSAAGACLVSSGRRGEDHLIIVVLGSASSDARYVDTRNLFRWAWSQRSVVE